mmetsp:Transcript_55012/g.61460  ORF Transcript_55012/g.61460 Transcript_55012/m.61460 type:complete len:231 (+) Transcript_55012:38-730(+)
MMFKSITVAIALLCVSGSSAFVSSPEPKLSSSSLQMINEEGMKKAAASFALATFVLGNVAAVAPAFAMDDSYFGSSHVIAARSGGRSGGRSSGARSSSARSSAPRPSSSSSTTVINRNTYVSSPSPMYSSPTVIMAPPVYNPMGGLGLSLGLNAVSNIGNDMRDYRQEREIQDTKGELQQSKMREAEMSARLNRLEQGQGQMSAQQSAQQQFQIQQQMLLQQQQIAAAAK